MNTQALRDLEREMLDIADDGCWMDEDDMAEKLRGLARKLAAQIELHDLKASA